MEDWERVEVKIRMSIIGRLGDSKSVYNWKVGRRRSVGGEELAPSEMMLLYD